MLMAEQTLKELHLFNSRLRQFAAEKGEPEFDAYRRLMMGVPSYSPVGAARPHRLSRVVAAKLALCRAEAEARYEARSLSSGVVECSARRVQRTSVNVWLGGPLRFAFLVQQHEKL